MIDAVTESYRKLLSDGGLRGESCDEWTVADLEEQLGIELPASYKAFLLLAGNGCQSLEGSMYAVEDDLASLQRAGQRIVEHEKAELPRDAFVFFVHQGFICQFFLLCDGDDPAVYECVEGLGPIKQVSRHFSDRILSASSNSRRGLRT